jgi:DNA polymerase-3 subunit delta'
LSNGIPRRAFEALVLDELEALETLQAWLADPLASPVATHLTMAEGLAKAGGAELQFARDMIVARLATEARAAAEAGPDARNRLASSTELWDKALDLFADADIYNLDMRQTLVSIFDALKQHAANHVVSAPAG